MGAVHKKILVIKLGALGDFIQALGPMKAIRKHHKDAHITLLTTKPFADLAEKSGYCDDIWIDTRPKWYQPFAWLKLRRQLNDAQFERVYDLQNNDRTALYFKLFYPKPEWVGVAPGASHRNTSPERTKGLAFYGHVQTLEIGGIKNISIDTLEWLKTDISSFGIKKPYGLIIPGSAANRPEKRWPVKHFISLCQSISEKEIQPVIIGTHAEKDITGAIANACPSALNLTGKTSLYDIASLARGAAFAVGNDTGPMHMIGPTGISTYVLFTRHSNPVRHAPLGAKVKAVICDQKNCKEIVGQISELHA
jgi:ADP-heptose:LPS heptosyltransferase